MGYVPVHHGGVFFRGGGGGGGYPRREEDLTIRCAPLPDNLVIVIAQESSCDKYSSAKMQTAQHVLKVVCAVM